MTSPGDVIRVEKGAATPEELAVLVTVLTCRRPQAPVVPGRRTGPRWSRPERTPRFPGPRSWRA
ncbi:acyl-CoA carboxylase subunit epsilon [Streptomyces fragilis]|uniref:Acyl-CoA carboxylase subunit epsilon n=1 Tax=Streptomyces fragilis TaxID=67301 RepID=A0ABV2YEZ7_9ACTN|nr:acyl-CoA carboxylase subunit epsilon [Streptomyces fragilis]